MQQIYVRTYMNVGRAVNAVNLLHLLTVKSEISKSFCCIVNVILPPGSAWRMDSASESASAPAQGPGGTALPSPGEFVLKKLFAQFVVNSEVKLKHIASQPLVSSIPVNIHYRTPPWTLATPPPAVRVESATGEVSRPRD